MRVLELMREIYQEDERANGGDDHGDALDSCHGGDA
jgi:hypothetical protein